MEDKKAIPVLPSRMEAMLETNGHPSGRSKPMTHTPNMERLSSAVTTILEELGEDPAREGLQKTPMRVAKALVAMTKGYWKTKDDVLNDALFKEAGSGMVVVRDIEFCSLCEHHLLPFTGKIHIGYIPSDTVVGLSKLARIADMFAERLQLQERITREVAEFIQEHLKAKGVAVMAEAEHSCMILRGVKKAGSKTRTSCFLGVFDKDRDLKQEFLAHVA